MANEIVKADWYQSLLEDIKSALTEGVHNARWTLIQTYHLVGRRILEEKENFDRAGLYGQRLCNAVAQSLGKSKSTIFKAVQFAEKFPTLDALPEGKNISWSKVVKHYLPAPKEEHIHHPQPQMVKRWLCDCGKEWKTDPTIKGLDSFTQRDYLIKFLKEKHKLNKLDGTWQENRDYARRAIVKFGYQEVKKMITISADPRNFWNNKITSFKRIYNKGEEILRSKVEKPYYKNWEAKQLDDGRWRVKVDGVWKEFAGRPSEIEYR